MSRLLLILLLAAPTLAHGYPLNDGSGDVVWAFEGHGSDTLGGPVHTFVGELRLNSVATDVTATIDGTLPFEGESLAVLSNEAPGTFPDQLVGDHSPYGGSLSVAPSFVATPVDGVYYGPAMLFANFVDVDSVAFDAAHPLPGGSWGPPD